MIVVEEKKATSMSVAKTALSAVRFLAAQAEVKIFDIAQQTNLIGNAGVVFNLNAIPDGDGRNERSGSSLYAFQLDFRWDWAINVADNVSKCRLIIFSDSRQVNNTQPTVLNLLAVANPNSQFTFENRVRFKILADVTQVIDSTSPQMVAGHIVKRLKLKCKYTGAAAATWSDNGLFLVVLSDETVNFPTLRFTSRLKYNDY